jgi:hypothetical protein
VRDWRVSSPLGAGKSMKQMYTGLKLLAYGLVASLFCTSTFAGQQTGTVNTINVNPVWGGFMVQLNTSVGSNYETQCPGNWAFMSIDDRFYDSTLAALMAAKATGELVVVYTTGCFQTQQQSVQFPKISTIDYGIRNGW